MAASPRRGSGTASASKLTSRHAFKSHPSHVVQRSSPNLPAGPGVAGSLMPFSANRSGVIVGSYHLSANVVKGFEFVPS